LNRNLYGLSRPRKEPRQPKEMPFKATKRHQFWTVDIRYLDMHRLSGGMIDVISILDNDRRAILASMPSRRQDLSAFLMVQFAAICQYGSPEVLGSDRGACFGPSRHNGSPLPSGSARSRSRSGRHGSPTSRPTSACSGAWRTGTSRRRRAGRSYWPATISALADLRRTWISAPTGRRLAKPRDTYGRVLRRAARKVRGHRRGRSRPPENRHERPALPNALRLTPAVTVGPGNRGMAFGTPTAIRRSPPSAPD
jgi:hypothetical protein